MVSVLEIELLFDVGSWNANCAGMTSLIVVCALCFVGRQHPEVPAVPYHTGKGALGRLSSGRGLPAAYGGLGATCW